MSGNRPGPQPTTRPHNPNRPPVLTLGLVALVLGVGSTFAQQQGSGEEGSPVSKAGQTPPAKLEPAEESVALPKLDDFGFIEWDAPVRSQDQSPEEHRAYNTILEFARGFPAAKLEARAARDLTVNDLLSKTGQDYQFDLIYFEGRLKQLTKMKPTRTLKEAAGVETMYEGWLFPKDEYNPVAVVFTELPAGLEPAREMSRWVGFAGYYFKMMRYESREKAAGDADRNKVRRTPLLLGKTVTLLTPPEEETALSWRGTFVPTVVGMIGLVALTALGLTFWFRRGDRAVRASVDRHRAGANPFE
jgi:hypothetical protein